MYFILLFSLIALVALISIPLALYAPPLVSLIVIVLLVVGLSFLHPARRISRVIRERQRVVQRKYRPAHANSAITLRPGDNLSPAEVSRLMSVLGLIPEDRSLIADLTATFLDLNRRGYLELSSGGGVQLLYADSLTIVLNRNKDTSKLFPHEQIFLRLLNKASGAANSVQPPALHEYAQHAPRRVQSMLDAFHTSVDRLLEKRKLFEHGKGFRSMVLTQRGEQAAALWSSYISNICEKPFLDSYRQTSTEQKDGFADDALRLLVDGASCGVCAKAASALQREYLFDPSEIWDEKQYFYSLSESRTAFSSDASGENYFFLPLYEFETALVEAQTF